MGWVYPTKDISKENSNNDFYDNYSSAIWESKTNSNYLKSKKNGFVFFFNQECILASK